MSRWIFVALSLLVLVGCGPIQLPDTKVYRIGGSPMYAHAQARVGRQSDQQKPVLVVASPMAVAGYDTRQMAYVQTPYQVSYFARHQWAAPPAQMLQSVLVEAVRQQGSFLAVLSAPVVAHAKYRLNVTVMALEQDFTQPISRERLILQATVIDQLQGKVLGSRCFKGLLPTQANTPFYGVLAANQLTTKIAAQLANWVARIAV